MPPEAVKRSLGIKKDASHVHKATSTSEAMEEAKLDLGVHLGGFELDMRVQDLPRDDRMIFSLGQCPQTEALCDE
jgi:hypothetical protein